MAAAGDTGETTGPQGRGERGRRVRIIRRKARYAAMETAGNKERAAGALRTNGGIRGQGRDAWDAVTPVLHERASAGEEVGSMADGGLPLITSRMSDALEGQAQREQHSLAGEDSDAVMVRPAGVPAGGAAGALPPSLPPPRSPPLTGVGRRSKRGSSAADAEALRRRATKNGRLTTWSRG